MKFRQNFPDTVLEMSLTGWRVFSDQERENKHANSYMLTPASHFSISNLETLFVCLDSDML